MSPSDGSTPETRSSPSSAPAGGASAGGTSAGGTSAGGTSAGGTSATGASGGDDTPDPTTTTPSTAPIEPASPTSAAPTQATTTSTTATSGGEDVQSEPGNLEYPDNVSALYQVSGGGEVSVSATWSGSPQLQLAVDCPGAGAQVQTGPSALQITVTAQSGTCDVSLSEPSGTEATVSYTLVLQYPGS